MTLKEKYDIYKTSLKKDLRNGADKKAVLFFIESFGSFLLAKDNIGLWIRKLREFQV